VYRSFIGFVKFDPNEGEANGKQVRTFVIRQTGVKDQAIDIRATLWPSHDHVELEQGDAVLIEGKFTVNKKEKDGETVTYFNLSVSNIFNFGPGDRGVREETTNGGSNDVDDTDAY
jgi:hypothetical protein